MKTLKAETNPEVISGVAKNPAVLVNEKSIRIGMVDKCDFFFNIATWIMVVTGDLAIISSSLSGFEPASVVAM